MSEQTQLTEMDRIQLRDRQLRAEQEEARKNKKVEEGVTAGSGFSGKLTFKIHRANPTFFQKMMDFLRFREL